MKKILVVLCTLFLILAAEQLTAQDDASMKAWMTYMTPGDMHKMLAESEGEWNEDITMWMVPGAPPTKSTATAVNKMILGGRYQQSMHTGSFNGMPFEGMSTLAYDNAKKVYFTTWIDNMSTGIMQMEGPWNESTKTMELYSLTSLLYRCCQLMQSHGIELSISFS